jgi:hypothetical protein
MDLDIEKESIEDRIFMIGIREKLVSPAEAAKKCRDMLPYMDRDGGCLIRSR